MLRSVVCLDSRCCGSRVRTGLQNSVCQGNCDYADDRSDEYGEELPLQDVSMLLYLCEG